MPKVSSSIKAEILLMINQPWLSCPQMKDFKELSLKDLLEAREVTDS